MKITMEFNLPEESEELRLAQLGPKYSILLDRIEQEIFRPARKYGYGSTHTQKIQPLLDSINEKMDGKGTELIGLLEELYYQIKNSELED